MVADLLSWPNTPSGAVVAVAAMVIFYTEIRLWLRSRYEHSHQPPLQPTPLHGVVVEPPKLQNTDDVAALQKQLDHLAGAAAQNQTEIAQIKAELLRFQKNIGYKKGEL